MNLKKIHDLARWHKSYSEFKSAIDEEFNGTPVTVVDNSEYRLDQVKAGEDEVICKLDGCNSSQVVEFLGRNKRQCQLCGESWKVTPE